MAQGTTKGVPIDVDPLLAADSDLLVPSQKAVKTYITGVTSTIQTQLNDKVGTSDTDYEYLMMMSFRNTYNY